MRSPHHRALRVLLTASVLVLAAGSTAAAATTAGPSRKARPCTLGQTYRYTPSTTPRVLTVKTSSVNVRKGPGTDCPIVIVVKNGKKLNGTGANAQLINSTSKWTQVRVTIRNVPTNLWVAITQVR